MHVFFQCVAEAVAEKGVRGLAELVPGGGLMFDIAKVTWEKYRQRRQMQQIRADVQQMAQASFEDAKQAAVEAVKPLAAKQPEIAPILETFLAQIPAATRQSLKRADDPTGTTVPANFSLRGPEDVAKLLPPSLPRFKPGDPLPGKAGWLLEKQLGIGGFGEVWLARKSGYESLLGAVKFCRSLDSRDRDLLHESKVIDQLLKHGDHPNIVKLMDVHLEGDAPWLMYEYVEGGDLTDLIHQWSALPPSERQQKALAALQELAAAIGHFHRLDPSIVHRDLKPANILRDKSGRLRITDFGISGIAAKHMIENETRGVTTRAGRLQSYLYGSYTPLYASPQQRDGAAPDPRDDVHALGVILYQMLTGQVTQGIGSDFAQDLKELGAHKDLIVLLGRCTAAKAERRPGDANKVARNVATLRPKKPAPPTPGDPVGPPPVQPAPARPLTDGYPFIRSAARGMVINAALFMGTTFLFSFLLFLAIRSSEPWPGTIIVSAMIGLLPQLAYVPIMMAGFALYRTRFTVFAMVGAALSVLVGAVALALSITWLKEMIPAARGEMPWMSVHDLLFFLMFIVWLFLLGAYSVFSGVRVFLVWRAWRETKPKAKNIGPSFALVISGSIMFVVMVAVVYASAPWFPISGGKQPGFVESAPKDEPIRVTNIKITVVGLDEHKEIPNAKDTGITPEAVLENLYEDDLQDVDLTAVFSLVAEDEKGIQRIPRVEKKVSALQWKRGEKIRFQIPYREFGFVIRECVYVSLDGTARIGGRGAQVDASHVKYEKN